VRGSSELIASGRHLHFAAFPFGSPLLVHLMSERARILPFNSSAFVGRAPLMAVPQTGDRLLPAPSPTASSTLPHTCACAFPHRELRAQVRADRSTTRRRSRTRTRTPARRRPARPPLHLRALVRATAVSSPVPCVRAPVKSPHTALAHALPRVADACCRARFAHRSAPRLEPPTACFHTTRAMAAPAALPGRTPHCLLPRLLPLSPASRSRQPARALHRAPLARARCSSRCAVARTALR
jgi:hypothetical protein